MEELPARVTLKAAFGEPEGSASIENPMVPGSADSQVFEGFPVSMPEVDEASEPEGELLAEVMRSLEEAEQARDFPERGVHALAWYVPYTVSCQRWGIYYDINAMNTVAAHLTLGIRGQSLHARFGAIRRCLWATVRRHELVHASVELASAHWVLSAQSSVPKLASQDQADTWMAAQAFINHGSPDAYRSSLQNADRIRHEEACATALEMSQTQSPSGVTDLEWTHFENAWFKDRDQMPPPYSLWREASASIDVWLSNIASAVGGGRDGALVHQLLALWPGEEGGIWTGAIPERGFISNNTSPSLDQLLLSGWMPECDKLRKFVESEAKRDSARFSLRKGKRHDLQIVPEGAGRSTPLDCHAFDRVPGFVLRNIATAMGMTPVEMRTALGRT